jgi:hypothetical protein
MNPAKEYRRAIGSLLVYPSDNEDELHEHFKRAYQELKEGYEIDRARGGLFTTDTNLFIYGIGLLAYGHLEVIEDVLENLPDGRNNARTLVSAIPALLPIPYHPFDAKKTREWFQAHRDHLVWSEEHGKFLLAD